MPKVEEMPAKGESWSPQGREAISRHRKAFFDRDTDARKRLGQRKEREAIERLAVLDPEAITHKRCTKCEKVKPVADFPIRRQKLKCGLIHVRPEASCRKCLSEKDKAWRERKKAEGVDLNARQREWKKKNTPAQKERRRIRERERQAIKRRKEGIPPRNFKKKRSQFDGPNYPAAPLREFLEQRGESNRAIADAAKMHERRIFALMVGEVSTITLSTLDRILLGLGCPEELHRLYPVEEALTGYAVLDPNGVLDKFAESEEML